MRTRAESTRRLRPWLAASVILLCGALGGARPASGATLAGSSLVVHLSVSVGDAGIVVPGRPAPVQVVVQSEVLVSGQLVVTAGPTRLREPVEVAGGSTKQFEVVVPVPVAGSALGVSAAVTEGRSTLGTASATGVSAPDTEVVGILPDLLVNQALPGPQPLTVDAGTARFAAVTDQDLAQAPASLGPLTVIATGPDGLSQLDAGGRQAILSWTEAGGELLVDAHPGDAVVGLPAAWQAPSSDPVAAGVGRVVFTGGVLAAGQWSAVVSPTRHLSGTAAVNDGIGGGVLVSTVLAADAGVKTPRLPWLVAFLVLYIALVGPVGFLVFRGRRRPERLWIVIPVVAVAFAGTGYVVGASGRSTRLVHGTILDTTIPGGAALSYVGVLSGGQGTVDIKAPPGWTLQRYVDPQDPQAISGITLTTAIGGSGSSSTLGLNAGQFGVVQASGPAGFSGQLAVDATATAGGGATGTVTNRTGYSLQDVTVLIGDTGVDIGALSAEAHRSFQVPAATANGAVIEDQLWNANPAPGGCSGVISTGVGGPIKCFAFNGSSGALSGGPTSTGLWAAAPDGLATETRGSGTAVAVGWTRSYRPPLDVAGHGSIGKGRTAVVGTAPVAPGSAGGPLAISRQIVRGSLEQVGTSEFMGTGSGDPPVVAWVLPPSETGTDLTLTIPTGVGEVDVWREGAWHQVANSPSTNNSGLAFVGPAPFPTPPTTVAVSSGSGAVPSTTLAQPGSAVVVPATLAPTATVPPVVPATVAPARSAVLVPTGGIVPLQIPQAIPGQVALGSGSTTNVTLSSDDAAGGAVYVRLANIAPGRAFDPDLLSLAVTS